MSGFEKTLDDLIEEGIWSNTATARYDPLVIDMGRTDLKPYIYISFCK